MSSTSSQTEKTKEALHPQCSSLKTSEQIKSVLFSFGPNIDDVRFSSEGRWKFEFLGLVSPQLPLTLMTWEALRTKKRVSSKRLQRTATGLPWFLYPRLIRRIVWPVRRQSRWRFRTESAEFAQWLSDNVGPGWSLVKTVQVRIRRAPWPATSSNRIANGAHVQSGGPAGPLLHFDTY